MSDEATKKWPAAAATLSIARQYIHDTVPCQRILHGSCSTRSCYIANGWDQKALPIPVEPRCKEFQIIADIDALIYPMDGRVNTHDDALSALREARGPLNRHMRQLTRTSSCVDLEESLMIQGIIARIDALLPAPDGRAKKEG